MKSSDTIFALSSGRLPSGVAIVRVSGPRTRFVVETMCGQVAIFPRQAVYRPFRGSGGDVIDRGLVTFFDGPHSSTGEDCAEFGLHGGRAVVARMLEEIAEIDGLRHAEAGEFTRRALLNGKIDLVEAEALADLVASETETQRRFALRNADGGQSALYADWRRRIVFGRGMLEAELDFADESDVPGSVSGTVWTDMEALAGEIEAHIAGFRSAEIVRDGFRVVILGAPNAGKSSLLNALVRRDVAIVTDEAGTTRDLVEGSLDLAGIKVVVTDTAGIRQASGAAERIGVERAMSSARAADLVLHVSALDVAAAAPVLDICGRDLLSIGSKVDLVAGGCRKERDGEYDLLVSALSGEGIDRLLDAIEARAIVAIGDLGNTLPSRRRHVESAVAAASALREACNAMDAGLDVRAEMLRQASYSLGRIVGAVDVEDLLDVIFLEFCIGK